MSYLLKLKSIFRGEQEAEIIQKGGLMSREYTVEVEEKGHQGGEIGVVEEGGEGQGVEVEGEGIEDVAATAVAEVTAEGEAATDEEVGAEAIGGEEAHVIGVNQEGALNLRRKKLQFPINRNKQK